VPQRFRDEEFESFSIDQRLGEILADGYDAGAAWNLAGRLAEEGELIAAAHWFLLAAEEYDRNVETGDTFTDDESEVADWARFHAFQCLLDQGFWTAAAMLHHRLAAEFRDEAEASLLAAVAMKRPEKRDLMGAYEAAVTSMISDPRFETLEDFFEGLELTPEDERASLELDALIAFALLRPDDPANPWNAGAQFSDAGMLEAAAWLFLETARVVRLGRVQTHDDIEDELEWAAAAEFNACRDLLAAGRLLSASVVLHRLQGEDREEAARLLNEALAKEPD